jgi:hypothetical protein
VYFAVKGHIGVKSTDVDKNKIFVTKGGSIQKKPNVFGNDSTLSNAETINL